MSNPARVLFQPAHHTLQDMGTMRRSALSGCRRVRGLALVVLLLAFAPTSASADAGWHFSLSAGAGTILDPEPPGAPLLGLLAFAAHGEVDSGRLSISVFGGTSLMPGPYRVPVSPYDDAQLRDPAPDARHSVIGAQLLMMMRTRVVLLGLGLRYRHRWVHVPAAATVIAPPDGYSEESARPSPSFRVRRHTGSVVGALAYERRWLRLDLNLTVGFTFGAELLFGVRLGADA